MILFRFYKTETFSLSFFVVYNFGYNLTFFYKYLISEISLIFGVNHC